MVSQPLFYTLAQVKFNPIEKIETFIPDIQEALRAQCPDFYKETKQSFLVEKNPLRVIPQETAHWVFSDIEKLEGYILSRDSLVFHTTNYQMFNDFLGKALQGIELVNAFLNFSYIERIGLRYLNAIYLQNDMENINPALLGLTSGLTGNLVHSFTETMVEVDDHTLIGKSLMTNQGLVWPPDLQSNILEVKLNVPQAKTVILDLDCFTVKRHSFELIKIQEQLEELHKIIKQSFQNFISASAV